MNDDNILAQTEGSVITQQDSFGTISFADEVIATIAGLATIDIEGVAGMSGKMLDGITEFLGKKNLSKGIKVEVGKEDVTVSMSIVVYYGVSIPEVCKSIQKSVKNAIETMAGLRVLAVNVGVQELIFKDSAPTEESVKTSEKPSKPEKEKRVIQAMRETVLIFNTVSQKKENFMKMKGSTRIVFSIYLLAVIAVCAYVLATLLGLLPQENLNRMATALSGGNTWLRILTFLILAVIVVVSFRLMFFGIKKEKQKTALIASYDSGTISIAVSALEDLAKKFVKQTEFVKGETIKVFTLGEEVELDLKIKILPEVNMPRITQEMQSGLIQYIETYSGIKVARVKVMIAAIDESIKENKIVGGG